MSRIEDALKRLKTFGNTAADEAPRAALPGPTSSRSKAVIEAPKHHVDEAELLGEGLLPASEAAGTVASEFRRIKRAVLGVAGSASLDPGGCLNVVMLGSALPGAGKTFCATNLAISVSLEREWNVLLIDGDIHKSHITRAFGLTGRPGLVDLLLDESKTVAEMLVQTDIGGGVQVLPSGPKHPQTAELLASDRMTGVLRELSARYPDRLVIVDSPPFLATSEAQSIALHVGQIVLVVEAGETSHEMLLQMKEIIGPDRAVSVILNKSRQWGPGERTYGDYGY